MEKKGTSSHRETGHSFGMDLALYIGGAILFSFPLLMTMEMWWLGFYMDRLRLALFLVVAVAAVTMLSHLEGEPESSLLDILGALVACAVGFLISAVMLLLLGIIEWGMSFDEVVGKIVLHAIPASIGAILARRLLEIEHTPDEEERRQGYGITIFLMGVGSIFLAFQLAPTEEIVLIAHKMSGLHAAALMLFSLATMAAIIAVGETSGSSSGASGSGSGPFPRTTLPLFISVGYALALLLSLFVLWSFGRLDGASLEQTVRATIVLGFPASLGAAAARLIL